MIAARAVRPLNDRQLEVLAELAHTCEGHAADRWCRPMDVGGQDGSHHSSTLRSLVRLGLAERCDRYGRTDGRGGRAAAWLYRITPAGRGAYAARRRRRGL